MPAARSTPKNKSHKKKPPTESPEVAPVEAPSIKVGETVPDASTLEQQLEQIRYEEEEREFRRVKVAEDVAKHRWNIAKYAHLLKDGVSKLDFDTHPFQKEIYQDTSLDLVIYGSAQWGKTEFLICDMATNAAFGFKVLFVTSTFAKRNAFVTGRLDPCLGTVPMYASAMENAAARNAKADSTQLKHFGPGQIDLIFASAENQFTSRDCDKAQIDEHQECDSNNIKMVDHRLMGSWYRGIVRVGHPSVAGNEINQNLDYLYQNSDQRIWKVPCLRCGKYQQLTWWGHVINEKRNPGGILSVVPRDMEYVPGGKFDMRPICEACHSPMNRLHKAGKWEAQKPGQRRHGYKMSALYNIYSRLDELMAKYLAARHNPHQMQEFVNKQLGEPWDMDGSKITEAMLANCAGGVGGSDRYQFMDAIHMQFRKESAR